MITFAFSSSEFGVSPEFADVDRALLFSQDQVRRWEEALRSLRGLQNSSEDGRFAYLAPYNAWKFATMELVRARDIKSNPTDDVVLYPNLVQFETPTAQAILHVLRELARIPAHYAALAAGVHGEGTIDWNDISALSGIMLFERTKRMLDEDAIDRQIHPITSTLSKLQSEHIEAMRLIQEAGGLARKAVDEAQRVSATVAANADHLSEDSTNRWARIKTEADELSSRINERVEEGLARTEASIQRADSTIENWIAAQGEQRQLFEPSRLWEERALTHSRNANRLKWLSVAFGILGLPLCAALVSRSYSEIGSKLKEGFLTTQLYDGNTALTFLHYQIVITAAIMVVLLTMYLWAMRIIVRLYTAEHHLAIDASARGAMNQTYLGLITAGAANEQDRPIVLSALFRPVQDGIVKDDGLPITGPASVISGALINTK